jgi:iron complex transport system ATP-binding protein
MENYSLIEAKNISVEIHSKKLLDDVSLEMRFGEILAVLGPNGAGKSTLRKVLCGDLIPTSGEVLMNGKPLSEWTLPERAKVRAVLPQDSSLNFPFSVLEVVLMGRAPHVKGAENKQDYEIARHALRAVEEADLEERIYPTLSGGERQRVQLARVLAQIWEKSNEPRYLLLDEPTANLDLTHQHQTLKLAREFARENVGVLLILHDLNLTAQYADKVILLKAGKIIASGTPTEVFTEEIIEEVFSVKVGIIKHPFFDCPLIIWKDESD